VRVAQSRFEREPLQTTLPVVELDALASEIAELLDVVNRAPVNAADSSVFDARWNEVGLAGRMAAKRIIGSILQRFAPWPFPFRRRTEAETRLRSRDSIDETLRLFERLLDAPGLREPTDLGAYFISLITRQRAEFHAWADDVFGVWAFKIKTGDHNWIEGRIWHEPGEQDDPSDPLVAVSGKESAYSSGHRSRYRYTEFLRSGSLRCYIEREDF
jgi:hypothetical protein